MRDQAAGGDARAGGAAALAGASPVERYLTELHARYKSLDEGTVATYIPELAKADPNWFGIGIATTDGHVYEVGDSRQAFTIQSISKPFAYGLALEDHGRPAVLEKIGVEPTGDAFNSISLEPGTGRPLNPMINAGAIATTSLVKGATSDEKVQRLLSVLSVYAGRALGIAGAVYRSESETGHRNRAIGHMLRNFDIIKEDPTPALDAYFQQCSIEVTCRDLALMAATLANGGVNPATGERALKSEYVDSVLSVMMSCGMYDYAGEWLYLVGAPAKSGVAGGILAVWPGHLGIAVFSPRLDARGNSVRGIRVCQDLSRELDLHALRVPSYAGSTLRATFDLSKVRSKRRRRASERRLLDDHGARAQVFQLQGDLTFAATEVALRKILGGAPGFDLAIVDLRRVTRVDRASTKLLAAMFARLRELGKRVVLADLRRHRELERFLGEGSVRPRVAADLDAALELCENDLMAAHQTVIAADGAVPLAEHDLLRGLAPAAAVAVEERLQRRTFRRGETIVREGEPAEDVFLLTEGEVSVVIELPGGQIKRLSTLSAGMSFGELAFINATARTADVRADTAVSCYVLPRAAWDALGETTPSARLQMLENMLRKVSGMAAALTVEVAALEEA
jgi:glutaminase